MATLDADHFQQYLNSADLVAGGIYAENNGWAISTANPPRAGGSHLRASSGGGVPRLRRVFGAPKTAGAGVGYRFYCAHLPTEEYADLGLASTWLLGWLDASANGQMLVMLGTDGGLLLYSGFNYGSPMAGGATLVKRVNPCITPGAYNQIEGFCAPGSSGSAEVRVNGATVLNWTGNTNPSGAGEVSQIFVQHDYIGGVGTFDLADFHMWDTLAGEGATDFVGNVGVLRRELSADTATAGWSKSTGVSGYPLLTDKSDGSYVEADSTTLKSAFAAGALPGGTTGIVAQVAKFRGLKTDGADCSVAASIISGSSETTINGQALTTAETWRLQVSGKDPATSAPWTVSGANASTPAITRTL